MELTKRYPFYNEMTEDVAFKLGQFDFPSFYSYATWRVNREEFPLFKFFKWGSPKPSWQDCDGDFNWTNGFTLMGALDFNQIKTIPQKLAYIRGRLTSYSVAISENKIHVSYANSTDLRDFFSQCLEDVLADRYWKDLLNGKFTSEEYTVNTKENKSTFPAALEVELVATKEIIDYITGRNS